MMTIKSWILLYFCSVKFLIIIYYVKWYSYFGKQFSGGQKINIELSYDQQFYCQIYVQKNLKIFHIITGAWKFMKHYSKQPKVETIHMSNWQKDE
jgi:hypothetical protein